MSIQNCPTCGRTGDAWLKQAAVLFGDQSGPWSKIDGVATPVCLPAVWLDKIALALRESHVDACNGGAACAADNALALDTAVALVAKLERQLVEARKETEHQRERADLHGRHLLTETTEGQSERRALRAEGDALRARLEEAERLLREPHYDLPIGSWRQRRDAFLAAGKEAPR